MSSLNSFFGGGGSLAPQVQKNTNSIVNQNLIINGDFSVWQRGTGFSGITTSVFTADRWVMTTSGDTCDVSRGEKMALGNPHQYLAIKPSVHNGNLGIEQRIENYSELNNKTVTVSVKVYVDETSTFDIYHGFNAGNARYSFLGQQKTVTAKTWQTLSWTYNAGSSPAADPNFYYSISIRRTDSGLAKYRYSEVKLELGDLATPFIAAPLSITMLECQRYYQKIINFHVFGRGHDEGTAPQMRISRTFITPMMKKPTGKFTYTASAPAGSLDLVIRNNTNWYFYLKATSNYKYADGNLNAQFDAEL